VGVVYHPVGDGFHAVPYHLFRETVEGLPYIHLLHPSIEEVFSTPPMRCPFFTPSQEGGRGVGVSTPSQISIHKRQVSPTPGVAGAIA